ncbi:MAG: RP853 family protein [Rickettsiaceae bacterium]
MSSKPSIPLGTDPTPFISYFDKYLSNNLSDKLRLSIANLLAIDYANRLKSQPKIDEYVNLCTIKLKKHLGYKVVVDEGFSSAMTLFIVAITPEQDVSKDEENPVKQSQDLIIESVITTHFGDLNSEELQTIRLVLKALLNSKDGKELMNLVTSNPKLFYSIVVSAAKDKKHQQEVNESVAMHLGTIATKSKNLDRKLGTIKSVFAKLALAGSMLAVTSLGLIFGGLALPAFVIPTTIVAIRYGPKLGDKIGANIASNIKTVKQQINSIQALRETGGIGQNIEVKSHSQGKQMEQRIITQESKLVTDIVGMNLKPSQSTKQTAAKTGFDGKKKEPEQRGRGA